jgi:hypothetical protein
MQHILFYAQYQVKVIAFTALAFEFLTYEESIKNAPCTEFGYVWICVGKMGFLKGTYQVPLMWI